jgi:RecB family exonuclease
MSTATFTNTHLSFSRLSRFEQCPAAFKLHYVDKLPSEPTVPLQFGKAIHAVLEVLVREHVEAERTARLSEERAIELWQDAWVAEGLTGCAVFDEGVSILRAFVRDQGELDPWQVLAVEREFRLQVGRFTVLGFIDRVDRDGDDGVCVVDYKSNRQLFSRDEVDSSLQLSLYAIAAKQLWPWAKTVRLQFHMLRHGIRMETARAPEQLEAALAYVETLGRQTEEATEFRPRLNTNCVWCDHRRQCPAYAAALEGKREFLCEDPSDLEAVAREREEVARLAKILYDRKGELEGILKAHIQHDGELVLGGVRYAMFNTCRLDYPLDATLAVLERATEIPRAELAARLTAIDKSKVDALLKELAKTTDRARIRLVQTELEAIADKSYSPRLWAKKTGESA